MLDMAAPTSPECIVGSRGTFIDFSTATIQADTLATTLPNETASFTFNWADRTNRPTLSASPGVVQLGGEAATSIIYNQHEYYLHSIQFAKKTHTALINPVSNQVNNVEDIILTFSDGNIIIGDEQHIVIIVPILRVSSGISADAEYLHAFTEPYTEPISLQSLIPSGPFASYTICTPRVGVSGSNQNLLILVSMQGLRTMTSTIMTILQGQTLAAYMPPPSVSFGVPYNTPGASVTAGMVIYTNLLAAPPAAPPAAVTEVSTNALKCVPLDPETQIDNGKIRIDPTTGKALDVVQADRLDTMAETIATKSIIRPETFIKGVSLFLGVFFFMIIAYLVVSFCVHYFAGSQAAGSHGPTAALSRSVSRFTTPAYFTTAIFTGLCGALIGYFVSKRV